MGIECLDQFGEVGERARQPIDVCNPSIAAKSYEPPAVGATRRSSPNILSPLPILFH